MNEETKTTAGEAQDDTAAEAQGQAEAVERRAQAPAPAPAEAQHGRPEPVRANPNPMQAGTPETDGDPRNPNVASSGGVQETHGFDQEAARQAAPPPVEGSPEAKRQEQEDFAERIVEFEGNRYRHLADLPDDMALVIRADDRFPAKPLIIPHGV